MPDVGERILIIQCISCAGRRVLRNIPREMKCKRLELKLIWLLPKISAILVMQGSLQYLEHSHFFLRQVT